MAELQNSVNANSTTPLSAVQGGSGVSSPTAHGLLIAEGSSAFTSLVLAAGQLAIGTTSGDPSAASLTAGSGISISSLSGSVTISTTGSSGVLPFTDVTGTTQAMAVNNGYTSDNAGLITFTLPLAAAYGTLMAVVGKNTGGWTIAQNAGQTIHFGNLNTTTGTGGSLASSNQYDNVYLLCITANTDFAVVQVQGNLTVT
jgi:hypothetical protein